MNYGTIYRRNERVFPEIYYIEQKNRANVVTSWQQQIRRGALC